ncbi:MAG: class I SAM-dependent methyltransferase, partial [Acidobacteriota bacterium]|nr:class I SAM-dependent methyltransferase [Acidobacteriota bacterium]
MNLVITRPWPKVAGNPKASVVERRLRKTRLKIGAWAREIDMLDSIFRAHMGAGARVLDVACGTGFSILELAARGYRTSGVDADPALCQLVAVAARAFGLPASAAAGDACRLPYADASFDVVMSRSFFEHVYDRDLALGEQLRVLRPGGLLFVNDGNLQNPRLLFDLLVSYPLRTRGRHGGPVWLLTKRRVW